MIKSMTGFGRCEETIDGFALQLQIKSVNNRYSDFTIKTPRRYSFLEEPLRALAAEQIARGKVEILLSLESAEEDRDGIVLDRPMAEGYMRALREMTEYGLCDDLTLSTMAGFHDIFRVEQKAPDEARVLRVVTEGFQKAMTEFLAMRNAEGERLAASLHQHLAALSTEICAVEERSPQCLEAYRERLRGKLQEILEDRQVDESRILSEAAIFADKIAVDEETVRLRSHMQAFAAAMEDHRPIGKKLDFIVQEMNREANTIGSKCNDLTIASHVVEMKSLIEKIREQIQNIE